MSDVDRSVSTDIFERRYHHIEKPLLGLNVLTIYKHPVVVDQGSVLRIGVGRVMSSSIDELETVWRHFFQSDSQSINTRSP